MRRRNARLRVRGAEVEIRGSVAYHSSAWWIAVPRDAGVYLIHDLRGVLYVGQSEDLRRRFEEHYGGDANKDLAEAIARPVGELRFSWLAVEAGSLSEVERSLVRYFDPPCNRIRFRQ